MSIFDLLLSSLAPHECLTCGTEGSLLCTVCSGKLIRPVERCYRCHKITTGAKTCDSCRRLSHLQKVYTACVYEGVAKDLVWKLKLSGAQAATRQMAKQMTDGLELPSESIIVPIPTATSRIRQRGYDQAELLARELAVKNRRRYVACLVRVGQAHQHGTTREQRLRQLQTSFRIVKARRIRGQHLILVDDVVTTGATLEAAARVLKSAGARRIDAIVFAQA